MPALQFHSASAVSLEHGNAVSRGDSDGLIVMSGQETIQGSQVKFGRSQPDLGGAVANVSFSPGRLD